MENDSCITPNQILPTIAWCNVPAGDFIMGSEQGPNEKPQHTVTIPYTYQASKYMLTSTQYSYFIDAGGYTEPYRLFWTETGWAEMIEKRGYKQPYNWDNDRFNLSNQPAQVSWYEAVAYCRWLTAQWYKLGVLAESMMIRLPTEAEWEKAARGTAGRTYPWGNEPPTPERANYKETGLGTTSPVGCLPQGTSPYGCLDMAGNDWEWCATKVGKEFKYKPYPYQLEDEWTDDYLAGVSFRALRGGAFPDGTDYLRAAYRDLDSPGISSSFRLFCVPIL